jgi:hypothetical protein
MHVRGKRRTLLFKDLAPPGLVSGEKPSIDAPPEIDFAVQKKPERPFLLERIKAAFQAVFTLYTGLASGQVAPPPETSIVQFMTSEETNAGTQTNCVPEFTNVGIDFGTKYLLPTEGYHLNLFSSRLANICQQIGRTTERLQNGEDPDILISEFDKTLSELSDLRSNPPSATVTSTLIRDHRSLVEEQTIEKAYDSAWEKLRLVREDDIAEWKKRSSDVGNNKNRAEKAKELLELLICVMEALRA